MTKFHCLVTFSSILKWLSLKQIKTFLESESSLRKYWHSMLLIFDNSFLTLYWNCYYRNVNRLYLVIFDFWEGKPPRIVLVKIRKSCSKTLLPWKRQWQFVRQIHGRFLAFSFGSTLNHTAIWSILNADTFYLWHF